MFSTSLNKSMNPLKSRCCISGTNLDKIAGGNATLYLSGLALS